MGPLANVFLAVGLLVRKIRALDCCREGASSPKRASPDASSCSLSETPPRAADRAPLPVVGVQGLLWM